MLIVRCSIAAIGITLAVGCAGEKSAPAGRDTASSAPVTAIDSTPRSPANAPTVTERGIGVLVAGMSVAEASAALDGALAMSANADATGCSYAEWRSGPDGVRVMVEDGRIARVDITLPGVRTAAGAAVGDTEEQVQRLYGSRATVSPHKYEAGHYLTVIEQADSSFALVFETIGGKVTRYRAGLRPQVEYVEGCS